MRSGIPFAAALAALIGGSSEIPGKAVLTDMFTPRFRVPSFLEGPRTKSGKHRNSGQTSPRHRQGNNAGHGKAHCGAKQMAKYAKRGMRDHYAERMAFNERHADMLAKKQINTGGKNAIMWGRK